ncbi:uncharacterized protein ACNLHF_024459 isoform 1-T2 [Anomaloglossus baeobatrachus]|uniref:uncharacterized protein LOC142243727 n=1 Tax=Anomaloglossus baeobatrachus TaxID=238106 RepID=UPI003F4F53A8
MQTSERSTRSSKRFVPEPAPEFQSAPTDTGQYMCIECSETFDTKLELNSHRQSHVIKKQFMCSHCGRGFHHQIFLQMHERSHEGGISRTSLTKAPAGRVISTRSTKSSLEADVIHVVPVATKPSYRLNSKVQFSREEKVNQDIAPRECVTRLTRGTSPPARQRRDSSDNKTFELRISKLSDSTIQLIDPFGNTLEILADVFSSYTIADMDEEEHVRPIDDSEDSAAPSSSSVPPDTTDVITQDLEVPAEATEPSEPVDDPELLEELPLCGIESVSSASTSPKAAPDFINDAEDLFSTHSTHVSDTKDMTDNERVDIQPDSETQQSSTEEEILPSGAQDALITSDDQREGAIEGEESVCSNELLPVTAGSPSLKAVSLDDPSSAQLEYPELLHGACSHNEGSPSLSESVSPEDLQEGESSAPCHMPVTENEKDSLLNASSPISDMDVSEDTVQLDTSCVMDSQDLESDHESLSDSAGENSVTQKNGLGSTNLEEGAQLAEVVLSCPDKSPDDTVMEDGRTNDLQTPLTINEHVPESTEFHEESITSEPGGLELDPGLQAEPSAANIDSDAPVDSAVERNGEQTTSTNELEPCSPSIDDETVGSSWPADICTSEPNSQVTSVMSLDFPDQRSDQEVDSTSKGTDEKVHDSCEKEAIGKPDQLSQLASISVPELLEAEDPPRQTEEPHIVEGQIDYETELLTLQTSPNTVGILESNPDDDPSTRLSSPIHDVQPQTSSQVDFNVDLAAATEMEADDSSTMLMGIVTENKENDGSHAEDEATEASNVDLSLTSIENKTLDPSEENVPICSDVEKTPELELGEGNPFSLFESAVASAEDVSMPPCDEVSRSLDVSFNVQSLVSLTSACVKAQEHFLTQGVKPTEQDAVASVKINEAFASTTSIEDAMLLEAGDPVTALCLLEPTLGLSPDLEDLSEKCLLSSDDAKDLADHDLDKNLSPEVPHKQYIQMSNADLTENDLAEDFVDSGALLLDATNLDETTNEGLSAVSVDENPVHELADLLSPEIQESECTEDLDDKHVGIGSQCLKCGRKVRRARREMVWLPTCYKCRIKTKREERHTGDGGCYSPDFVLEKGFDRKKGSSDFSSFSIKEEADSAQGDPFYRAVKSVHSMQAMKQESAAPQKKYKCPKCEKAFRVPMRLTKHMKCHALPQCVSCGCPMMLKNKTKRIPKRCHKCFRKMKLQKKKQQVLAGEDDEDDSLDSGGGSPFVDEDSQDQTDNEESKPGSVNRSTEPSHSIFMRKGKKMNPAIQALFCTCDVVLKSGARRPKICKNCQKPIRDRLARPAGITGKPKTLKTTKKLPQSKLGKPDLQLGDLCLGLEDELSPDEDEFSKEQETLSLTDLDITDQMMLADGEKPRLCPQCGKLFKCNRSMNLHLLSHTATQCESCGCRLQKKKRAGRWSKRCRVCRLLTKDKGLPDSVSEDLPSEKLLKEKNMASHRMKIKQSKIMKSRKLAIAKHKKDLNWMNMILAVKGLTQKPRKKKEKSMKSPSEEKTGYSSDPAHDDVHLDAEGNVPGTSGLSISQKKVLGGIHKVNKKCMYREKNIIKVEEHQLPPYSDDPSSIPVSVKEEEENQCLECNEIFPSLDLLLSHQQGHVQDQPFMCPQCPQSFSTEQYLTIHISTHAEGPPFRCLECNKTFTRRNHLGVHRRVHTGSRPYTCPDCPCRFRQKGSLIIHRYTHRNLQFMMLKPHQCSVCDKSFKQKERLIIHERIHTGECPFSCKDCDKVFPSKSRLYVHRKTHKVGDATSRVQKKVLCKEEGGQPYQCKDCGKLCSTKASFVLHCKVHKSSAVIDPTGHKENPEEDTKEAPLVCKQELDIKSEPEAHPFTCKDCNKVCSTKASLVLHRKVHGLRLSTGGPAFICKECNKVCSSKGSLVHHRKMHKSQMMFGLKATVGDPPYTCPDCNKICSTKASFVLHCKVHWASASKPHMLKTKLEPKTFVCKDCGFICSTKGSFVLHRKIHRASPSLNPKDGPGDHPFTCQDCNKICSTKASLVLHRRVHKAVASSDQSLIPQAQMEEKPYHCKDCGKIYSTKGRLLSHMKLHSGQDGSTDGDPQLNIDAEEKPFPCPVCNMKFTRLKILVRHKLIHGEDVFSCVHCGKRFLFHKSLLNHVPICLKRSKNKSLLGKDKVPKKRKIKDGSNGEESVPKKRKYETKKVLTTTQKLKNKKLIKAKKLAINKEKVKVKKPKKTKAEAEPDPEAGEKEQSDEKPEKPQETTTKEKEIGKEKKPKDVGKVKKEMKKVPQKQKRQTVGSESLKKWRIIAAATVKKRKLQAVMSGGKKKKETVKKKGPSKAKSGGKSSKE